MILFEVSKLPLFQKLNGSFDILVHHPILAVERYDRTEFSQEIFQICRSLGRTLHLDGLCRIHLFDSKHSFYVLDHFHCLGCGVATHADVILLLVG